MEEYRNFGELAAVVLESLFHESGKELTKETKAEILGSFRTLPAYDDVPGALEILRNNGIRTFAVSNSSLEMIKEQLGNAGICMVPKKPVSLRPILNVKKRSIVPIVIRQI